MIKRIDFHSHVLPGADHGSSNVETSLKMVELQKSAGITEIVATPHFYPDKKSVDSFLALRKTCAEKLKAALPANDAPTIYLGAEVLVCPELDQLEGLDRLCIEGTRTLLLEMPFSSFSEKILYTVENLTKQDYDIVMAHIDRYNIDDVIELLCLPVLAQVNAEQLVSRKVRKQLEQFFVADRIVAFGSDLHGANETTIRKYQKGLTKLGEFNEQQIDVYTRKLIAGARPL